MGSESADRQQMKVKEFMGLLPLTLAISGIPQAAPGTYFTEGQLEARATAIRAAYKAARQVIRDIAQP